MDQAIHDDTTTPAIPTPSNCHTETVLLGFETYEAYAANRAAWFAVLFVKRRTLADQVRGLSCEVGALWCAHVLAGAETFEEMPVPALKSARATMLRAKAGLPVPPTSDPFYWSPPWRAFRRVMLASRPTCEVAGCTEPAGQVEHITPPRDGGAPYDPGNARCVCAAHSAAFAT